MTLTEIKEAIAEGKTVCWSNDLYTIKPGADGELVIYCKSNDHQIGLTCRNGVTLNGPEEDFYIKGESKNETHH